MPIYEYECQACGNHFEEMQKINDPELVNCPNCGKPKLKRLISSTSFQLKGGGYYATDYKSPKKTDDKPADTDKSETSKKSNEVKEKAPEKTKEPETKKD